MLWLPGRKSRLESFAGANKTLTIEAMMGDRRALQVTHLVGTETPCLLPTQALCGSTWLGARTSLPHA